MATVRRLQPDEDVDDSDEEAFDDLAADEADDLADTGLDLSEAGDLDADNVLADEESSRVLQAPD